MSKLWIFPDERLDARVSNWTRESAASGSFGGFCWGTAAYTPSPPVTLAPAAPARHPGPAREPVPQPSRCDNATVLRAVAELPAGAGRLIWLRRVPGAGGTAGPASAGQGCGGEV